MIVIKQPVIVDDNLDNCKLVTPIIVDGKEKNVFLSTSQEYKKYMVTENCDAALSIMFPMAIRNNHDITCEAPVTEILLYNMREYAEIAAVYNSKNHLVKIEAKKLIQPLPNESAVVTTASLGVDSLFAIHKFHQSPYSQLKLTHIMHNDILEFRDFRYRYVKELKQSQEKAFQISNMVKEVVRNNVLKVANELNLTPLFLDSNINEWQMPSNPYLFFANTTFPIYSFAKLFGSAVVPGSYDLSHFSLQDMIRKDTTYHECLNLLMFSTANGCEGGVKFISDSLLDDRLDRIGAILDFSVAQKYMNVCWYSRNGKNCSTCSKCARTIVLLDYFGELDKFKDVFNVDYYNKNFAKYKHYLLDGRDLKANLRVDEQRYKEICERVISKHES